MSGFANMWLLLLACAACNIASVQCQNDPNRPGTDLSCAVIIWGDQDYEWTQNGKANYTSNCIESVLLARERCGGSSINFVVTHFWKGSNASGNPVSFCYKTNKGDDQIPVICTDLMNTTNATMAAAGRLVDRFYKGMKMCFKTAILQGFLKLKVTPHLDDGAGKGGWRNLLRLHPFERLNGWSYSDVMMRPLARALNESIIETNTAETQMVYFTLQGEMNLALAAYPYDWQYAINEIRQTLAGEDPIRQSNVRVGVSMNFNKLCGSYCDPARSNESSTAPVSRAVLEQINMEAYKQLLYSVDFLGISNYPQLWTSYQQGWMDMESSSHQLSAEMQEAFNITLNDLIYAGKEFHLSEFGIGGGQSQCGCQPAANISTLANQTFFGLFGIYGHFPDPWQNQLFRDFRKEFYRNAIWWLANKGGPGFRVDGAFIWCMSSWDVSGVYWTSRSAKGTYYDPEVMQMVKAWNDWRQLPS